MLCAPARIHSFLQTRVEAYGCPSEPIRTEPYPEGKADSKSFKEYWGPCTDDNGNTSEVILISVAGMIHDWATAGKGSTNEDPEFNGKPFDIDGSEEAWAFLKNHSLEGSDIDVPDEGQGGMPDDGMGMAGTPDDGMSNGGMGNDLLPPPIGGGVAAGGAGPGGAPPVAGGAAGQPDSVAPPPPAAAGAPAAGATGMPIDDGAVTTGVSSDPGEGCACGVSRQSSAPGSLLAGLLGLGLLARRRRN